MFPLFPEITDHSTVRRILYASERPPYPFFMGGAARSAHYMMTHLAKDLGASVLAVGSQAFAAPAWTVPDEAHWISLDVTDVEHTCEGTTVHCGYPVRLLPNFSGELRRIIDAFDPEIVWTQLDGIDTIARIAREAGRTVVVFLRDAENPPEMLRRLAAMGCGFICNSRFMADRVRRHTGKSAGVIYPSLETDFGVQGDPRGCVTMINPHRVKGVETFLEVARRLPDERFLLVESWPLSAQALAELQERLAPLPNVEFSHRVPDAAAIYRRTRLLLVPSVWEEAFGRVVIEAQSCAIPVIASRRGGLPESVGDGGLCIDEYLDPGAWVRAILSLTGDSTRYEELAARAREHAERAAFKPQEAARRFLNFCREPHYFRPPLALALRARLGRLLGRTA